MEEIKILELFGGIGAIRKAFKRQNIPGENEYANTKKKS